MLQSLFGRDKTRMVAPADALPGRAAPAFPVPDTHAVLGTPIQPPFPAHLESAIFGLGCFWGAERVFWELPGVYSTAVGYSGGFTPHPTYEEVCSAKTGHTEVVLVVFDPAQMSYSELIRTFWESHKPNQGMRQGNDIGTQYRSAIYFTSPEQEREALASRDAYDSALRAAGLDPITTEIAPAGPFYYAEDYHQQYLHKVPGGYCGIGGCQVPFPVKMPEAAATR